ncbi:YfjI family protein [Escherichia coli]|uniref:YfjI family protein n=1 Tax=Escherichia coli TaxID=562 RepID=UPI002FBE2FD1
MNLLEQNYQETTPAQRVSSNYAHELRLLPLKCFPPIIRYAIVAACVNKKVPVEITVSTFLAAASLACLPLVEVIPVHTTIPEPAVLNFLVMAKSGAGKSTVLRPAMQVFYDFSSEASEEYAKSLKQYKTAITLWEEAQKALARNLRQAINRNYSGDDERAALENHLQNEPHKPVRFKFLYQDVSNGELLRSLKDNPEAGIFSEEAVTFFKSRAKNDPGIFNLGWDGAPYSYQREGIECDLNLRLMFCLMVQPEIFDEYIASHPDTGRGSGFLARFLIARVDGTCEYKDGDYSYMNRATETFDNRVRELLERAKQRFYCGITDKQQLMLSPQAIAFMGEKRAEVQQKIKEGGPWEHIADIALKSGANTLRLAAIFHYFSEAPEETISRSLIECAHEIIEWYIQQACKVFYKNSRLSQFEKDVLEVYHWIHNRMLMKGTIIIPKSEIMQYGPKHKSNNLRQASKLNPVLEQLTWQRRIFPVQDKRGGPVYFTLPNQYGVLMDLNVSTQLFPYGGKYISVPEIQGRVELDLPHLVFSW